MNLPKKITIREVGPREGFQTLPKTYDTKIKADLINMLSQTGLSDIEVTSFVRADKVPQMADAAQLVEMIDMLPGINYTALYLNQSGFRNAEKTGRLFNKGWISAACSETFLAKNSNTSLEKMVSEIPSWLETFAAAGKQPHGLMISTAFGCSYEGRVSAEKVVKVISRLISALAAHQSRPVEICLADTMGWADPIQIQSTVNAVRKAFKDSYLTLHLHDTRGAGLANAFAAMQLGIDCFDSSIGGLGGCPFAKGAGGNIATEDLAFLCSEMGIETGLDLNKLASASIYLEKVLGKELPGKYYKTVRNLPELNS